MRIRIAQFLFYGPSEICAIYIWLYWKSNKNCILGEQSSNFLLSAIKILKPSPGGYICEPLSFPQYIIIFDWFPYHFQRVHYENWCEWNINLLATQVHPRSFWTLNSKRPKRLQSGKYGFDKICMRLEFHVKLPSWRLQASSWICWIHRSFFFAANMLMSFERISAIWLDTCTTWFGHMRTRRYSANATKLLFRNSNMVRCTSRSAPSHKQ